MRLAILLTSGFESRDCHTVLRLAEASLGQGHAVSVFLMDDGVYSAPQLASLSERGALVVWCSHNAQQRGLAEPPGVQGGSQFEWAAMVAGADRVVSFG
ncbi:MAG: DsrE family protein [Bacteroidetes bacterium]|nr:DsrE family protein [Bacteroidota bacterium]